MELPINLIISSHLSDIQETSLNRDNDVRINFIKHLLNEFPNTRETIDADAEWERFKTIYPNFFK